MTFYEHLDPSSATISDELSRLFPAVQPRPFNDNYHTTLLYTTTNQLYNALVAGKISAGTDPIRNAEWLRYPYDMRLAAYNQYIAYPNGLPQVSLSTSSQKTYTVISGDYGIKIARQFNIPFTSLRNLNQGRAVRKMPRGTQGLYRKDSSTLYTGDVLLIPSS